MSPWESLACRSFSRETWRTYSGLSAAHRCLGSDRAGNYGDQVSSKSWEPLRKLSHSNSQRPGRASRSHTTIYPGCYHTNSSRSLIGETFDSTCIRLIWSLNFGRDLGSTHSRMYNVFQRLSSCGVSNCWSLYFAYLCF